VFSDKRITARTVIPRPDPTAWRELVGASASSLCDGQGRRGSLDAGLRPVTSATAFAGPALTVQCRPGDNLTALAALEWVRPGDVVVLANGGYCGAALVGGNYVDLDELEALGLPVFARGAMPAGPMKASPGTIGFPVAVGDVTISSGDVLVGDRDGVVVVRQQELAVAIAGYRAVRAREAQMAGIVGTGTVPAWLGELIAKVGIDRVAD
jgi:4-hydroxy-4-methyl-2-oxoglutarate aldolase